MNQASKLIKTKVGLLHLAEQLGNVSQACKVMGYCISLKVNRTGNSEFAKIGLGGFQQ